MRSGDGRTDLDLCDLALEPCGDGPVLGELLRELADERPELGDRFVG